VEVKGFGVLTACPTAVIIVQEGEEVIPQTKLHLIGRQSYAATGVIEDYVWEVRQPVGSQSVFLPSAIAPHQARMGRYASHYLCGVLTAKKNQNWPALLPWAKTLAVALSKRLEVPLGIEKDLHQSGAAHRCERPKSRTGQVSTITQMGQYLCIWIRICVNSKKNCTRQAFC
jgi:hypothetical protein